MEMKAVLGATATTARPIDTMLLLLKEKGNMPGLEKFSAQRVIWHHEEVRFFPKSLPR